MESTVYLCPECKKVYKVQGNDKKIKCTHCSVQLIDSHILMEEWSQYDSQKKEDLKLKLCEENTVEIEELEEIKDKDDISQVSDNNTNENHNGSFFERLNSGNVICSFCGAENEEGSQFCYACGKQMGEQTDSLTNDPVNKGKDNNHDLAGFIESVSGKYKEKKKLKIGKGPIIAAVVIVLVLAAGFIFRDMIFQIFNAEDNTFMYAYVDSDDTAFLPLMNGDYVKINDAKTAIFTPDRKRIVVEDIANRLYVTDPKLTDKTVVADDMKNGEVKLADDTGVMYVDNGSTYMYRYSGGDPIKLSDGYINDYLIKDGNLLYKNDKSIYILTKSAAEREKIGGYDNECDLLNISKDGKKAYWTTEDSSEEDVYNVYCYSNGEKVKICSYSSEYSPKLIFNDSETYGILGSSGAEAFYVVDDKNDVMKVGMGNPTFINSAALFCEQGFIFEDKSSAFEGLYILAVGSNDAFNLYYIDNKGEREKVLTDVKDMCIRNGHIYYRSDDEMRCAKLNGAVLKNDKKIASDVDNIITSYGKYVYFSKDTYTSNNGIEFLSLYAYSNGNEPVKIADEVIKELRFSADGKTVYYFRDPDSDFKGSNNSATLYKYTYGKNKAVKISDSVCCGKIYDGTENDKYKRNEISDRFIYYKKIDHNDYQWMYYNGKDSILMVPQLEL